MEKSGNGGVNLTVPNARLPRMVLYDGGGFVVRVWGGGGEKGGKGGGGGEVGGGGEG